MSVYVSHVFSVDRFQTIWKYPVHYKNQTPKNNSPTSYYNHTTFTLIYSYTFISKSLF